MSYYAQTSYSQLQGMTHGGVRPKYSISAIGCFITSFSNLLKRFGTTVAPDKLDDALAAAKLYIDVDDGIYDDVGWTTIIALYPKLLRLDNTGTGKPTSDNSIVKFNYTSPNTGNWTTHFCLVKDAKTGTIIDSWDGKVKSWNVYGGPVAYATYSKTPSAIKVTPQGDSKVAYTQAEAKDWHDRLVRLKKQWESMTADMVCKDPGLRKRIRKVLDKYDK